METYTQTAKGQMESVSGHDMKIPKLHGKGREGFTQFLLFILGLFQALILFIWNGHVDDFERLANTSEVRLDALELFQAETQANRFTSQDALRMNATLLEAIYDVEDELKKCIRTQDC